MVKPQQPELRRSDLGATSDDATKARLTAPNVPGVDGRPGGPVPDENRPGHQPEHDQDKPSGNDFVAKVHALAEAARTEGPSSDASPGDGAAAATRDPGDTSDRAERLAGMAGAPFRVVGGALSKVRDRLPE